MDQALQALRSILLSPFAVAIGLPLIFFVIGGLSRLLARRKEPLWKRDDWYLAPDIGLAAFAASLTWFAETLPKFKLQSNAELAERALLNVFYLLVAFVTYILMVALQQALADETSDPRKKRQQFWTLVVGCNVGAAVVFAIFVLVIKGVGG
jgi:hypothetical protein